jgi:hypothetical protein
MRDVRKSTLDEQINHLDRLYARACDELRI